MIVFIFLIHIRRKYLIEERRGEERRGEERRGEERRGEERRGEERRGEERRGEERRGEERRGEERRGEERRGEERRGEERRGEERRGEERRGEERRGEERKRGSPTRVFRYVLGGFGITSYVFAMEYIGKQYRGPVGIMVFLGWIVCLCLLALLGYLVPSWRTLSMITSVPGVAFIFFWFFGRKKTMAVSMWLAAVVGIAAALLSYYDDGSDGFMAGKVLMSMVLGKFFITIAFDVVYLYSSELFPTTVRNTAMGTSSAAARIGSAASPYIIFSQRVHPLMPFGIMAINALICGILCMTLPETTNKSLADTVDQVHESSSSREDEEGMEPNDHVPPPYRIVFTTNQPFCYDGLNHPISSTIYKDGHPSLHRYYALPSADDQPRESRQPEPSELGQDLPSVGAKEEGEEPVKSIERDTKKTSEPVTCTACDKVFATSSTLKQRSTDVLPQGFIDDVLNTDLHDIDEFYQDDSRMIVAELDGQVVGMAGIARKGHHQPAVAELQRVSVSSTIRNRGIGKKLLNQVEQFCKAQKYNKVVLGTSGIQYAALGLYKKFGFEIKHIGPFPAMFMEDIQLLLLEKRLESED
ncbi:hypothetical protein QZH41_007063 [Actinostola sp. cb2023]|nr:hypothetical protein QZH41_007063 [Actinostola sp. cb2023]